jgi:hypothetical protein
LGTDSNLSAVSAVGSMLGRKKWIHQFRATVSSKQQRRYE